MEFSASVPAEHFKDLTAILDLYSHFSETINLDIRNTQFIIGTVNNSRTAQCICRFARGFFNDYKLLRRDSPNTSMQLTVSNKLFNGLFKRGASTVSMCQIRITEENVNTEHHIPSKVFITRVSQSGKSKSSIPYTDGDRIEPLYTHNNMHHFVMSHMLLKQYLARFHTKVVDIVFECTPHTITVQSYWDEKAAKGDRPNQNTFTINSIDCYTYSVIEPVRVVVNLKEFRAIFDFMETADHGISAEFEDVGKPIIFNFKHQNLIAMEVALMTQNDETQNAATMEDNSMASIPSELFNSTPPTPLASNNRSNRSPTTLQRQNVPQQQQRTPQNNGSRRSSNIGTTSNRAHTTTASPLRPQTNRSSGRSQASPGNMQSPAQATRERPANSPQSRQNNETSRTETPLNVNDVRYRNSPIRPQAQAQLSSPSLSIDSLPSIKGEMMELHELEEEEPLFHMREKQKKRISSVQTTSQQAQRLSNQVNEIRISSHDAPTEKEVRMTTLEKLRQKKQKQKEQEQAQAQAQQASPELNMRGPLFDEAGRRIDRGSSSNNPLLPFDSNATVKYVYDGNSDVEEEEDAAYEYINRFKTNQQSPVMKKRRGIPDQND